MPLIGSEEGFAHLLLAVADAGDAPVFAGRRRVLTDAMAGAGWPAPTPPAGMYVRLALVRDDAVLRGAAARVAGFLTASS